MFIHYNDDFESTDVSYPEAFSPTITCIFQALYSEKKLISYGVTTNHLVAKTNWRLQILSFV